MTTPPTFSGELAPLFEALAKAQAEIDPAIKRSNNPHFRSRYADLSTVLDAILPPLNRHGLALLQLVGETVDNSVSLTTVLSHSSGAMLSTSSSCPLGRGGGPQGAGSGLTYLRRYAAQAIVGLPTADDDGNAAQQPVTASSKPQTAPKKKSAPKAKKKVKAAPKPKQSKQHDPSFSAVRGSFAATCKDIGTNYEELAFICEELGRPRPSMMNPEQRSKLIDWYKGLETDKTADWTARFESRKELF